MSIIKNEKLAAQLRNIGFTVEGKNTKGNFHSGKTDGPTILIDGTAPQMLTFAQLVREGKVGFGRNGSRDKAANDIMHRESGWAGGRPEKLEKDLAGAVDMAPFQTERAELERTGLLEKLNTAMADVTPRRRRIMSEHDGEWSMDRQWDITPFTATTKMQSTGRVLNVVVHGTVSGGMDARDYDRYGAMVWAIIDIIESFGITCGVKIVYRSEYVIPITSAQFTLHVKQPGEYLAPSILASLLQCVTYRRNAFSMWVAAADIAGGVITEGYGRGHMVDKRIQFKDGEIVIAPEYLRASGDQMAKELIETIQLARAAA